MVVIILTFISIIVLNCIDKKVIEKKNIYGGETIETNFSENDKPYSDNLSKQIDYKDSDKKTRKIEIFLNDKTKKENNIIKQVEYYSNKGIAEKYEVYFTENRFNETGISKNVEYVDEKDKILKIEYYQNDNKVYEDSGNDNIKFYLLKNYNDLINSNYLELKNKEKRDVEFFVFEKQLFKYKTIIKIIGEPENIDENEKRIIEVWCKQFKKNEYLNYNKKVLVDEFGVKQWIYIDDKLNIKKNTNYILYYFNIGGYKTKTIYLLIKEFSHHIS